MNGESINRISDSVALIEKKLKHSESIHMQALADHAYVSRTHYQRLFHSVMGEPVMEYIKKRRLQMACQALCESKETVLSIALRYGYESHEGFTRAFKAFFGVTPMLYRKLNGKIKSAVKGDKKMLSTHVVNRIAQNMKEIAKMLGEFQVQASELSKLAGDIAEKNGLKGATVTISSRELYNLSMRIETIRSTVQDFDMGSKTLVEIFDKIYATMKAVDDATFQTHLLQYLSGIEIARIGKPREEFAPIANGFSQLCTGLSKNKNVINGLVNDLIQLIREDIKKAAKTCMDTVVVTINECVSHGDTIVKRTKAAAERLGENGGAFRYISEIVAKSVESNQKIAKQLSELVQSGEELNKETLYRFLMLIEDNAFSMNLNAFNASVETVRCGDHEAEAVVAAAAQEIMQYAGELHKVSLSCKENFDEALRLTDLLQNNTPKTPITVLQEVMDDILFQSAIMLGQLGLEAARINKIEFMSLARKAEEHWNTLAADRSVDDSVKAKETVMAYSDLLFSLAKEIDAAAAEIENGDPFTYIAADYFDVAEGLKRRILCC